MSTFVLGRGDVVSAHDEDLLATMSHSRTYITEHTDPEL